MGIVTICIVNGEIGTHSHIYKILLDKILKKRKIAVFMERVIPVSLCRRKHIQNKKNKSIIFLLETLLYFKKNHSQRRRASDVLPLHADTGTVRGKGEFLC